MYKQANFFTNESAGYHFIVYLLNDTKSNDWVVVCHQFLLDLIFSFLFKKFCICSRKNEPDCNKGFSSLYKLSD